MADYRQIHIERKQRVLALLDRAAKYLEAHEYPREAANLRSWHKSVQEEQFSIAVVGEFSAGKSTFLNALLHEKLLPSFSSETTATLTFLRHRDKAEAGEEGKVYYKDGTVKSIPKVDGNTIAQFVSTSSEEKVAATISHFDIFLENKFLQDNVTLVDTPGLNGLAEGHAELTKEQIERSNASIFLFNASQPGKKTDFKALAELRSRVPSIFLLLNRIDELNAGDQETAEDIVADLQNNYLKEYPDAGSKPAIYPISAIKALVARSNKQLSFRERSDFSAEEKAKFEAESHLSEFEERLWQFLTEGEKGKEMLLSPVNQLKQELADVMEDMSQQAEFLRTKPDAEELETQLLNAEKALEELEKSADEISASLQRDLREAERSFTENLLSGVVAFRDRYIEDISAFTDLDEIDPDQIMRTIDRKMNQILQNAYEDYSVTVERAVMEYNAALMGQLPAELFDGIRVKLSQTIDLPETEIGMEQFEAQIEALQSQRSLLEEQLDAAEGDRIKMRKLNRQKEALERRITTAEESHKWYEQNAMSVLPSVHERNEVHVEKVKREGIFGAIANVMVGKKSVPVTEHIVDRSERDKAMSEINRVRSQHQKEISALREEIDKIGDTDTELLDMKQRKLERKLRQMQDEEKRIRETFTEKVKQQCAAQLRKQKREIEDYINAQSDDLVQEAKRQFREKKNAQLQAILTIVTAPIIAKVERQRKEMELLKRHANDAEAARTEQLNQITASMEELRPILSEVLDMKDSLDAISANTIE